MTSCIESSNWRSVYPRSSLEFCKSRLTSVLERCISPLKYSECVSLWYWHMLLMPFLRLSSELVLYSSCYYNIFILSYAAFTEFEIF